MRKKIKIFNPIKSSRAGRLKAYLTGFTLIELMIVCVILATLVVVGLVNYNVSKAKSRDSRKLADLHELQSAILLYKEDTGNYPINHCGGAYCYVPPATTSCSPQLCTAQNTCPNVGNCDSNILIELTAGGYIDKLPTAPVGSTSGNANLYYYYHDVNGDGSNIHAIFTTLEVMKANEIGDAFVITDPPQVGGVLPGNWACRMNDSGLPDSRGQNLKNSYCIKL